MTRKREGLDINWTMADGDKGSHYLITILGRCLEIVQTALLHNIRQLPQFVRRAHAFDGVDVDIRHLGRFHRQRI